MGREGSGNEPKYYTTIPNLHCPNSWPAFSKTLIWSLEKKIIPDRCEDGHLNMTISFTFVQHGQYSPILSHQMVPYSRSLTRYSTDTADSPILSRWVGFRESNSSLKFEPYCENDDYWMFPTNIASRWVIVYDWPNLVHFLSALFLRLTPPWMQMSRFC